MKANSNLNKEAEMTLLTASQGSSKTVYRWLAKNFLAVILTALLLAILSPAQASTGKERSRKCNHKVIKTSIVYPVIFKSDNHSNGYNKNFKKTRNRNFSFPV